MPGFLRASLAGMLGLACAGLVACGGSSAGLLSAGQSAALNGRLSQIASAISSNNCGQATAAASSFEQDVANLPANVNPTLRQNLIQGAATVAQLTPQTCRQASTVPTVITTTATQTQPTTTSTSTQPPATSTASPPSTSTAAPPTPTSTSTTPGTGGAGLGGTTTGGSSGGAGPPGGG